MDLCRVAGVARSSYYAWRSPPLSARAAANVELMVEIRQIHEASRRTYGDGGSKASSAIAASACRGTEWHG